MDNAIAMADPASCMCIHWHGRWRGLCFRSGNLSILRTVRHGRLRIHWTCHPRLRLARLSANGPRRETRRQVVSRSDHLRVPAAARAGDGRRGFGHVVWYDGSDAGGYRRTVSRAPRVAILAWCGHWNCGNDVDDDVWHERVAQGQYLDCPIVDGVCAIRYSTHCTFQKRLRTRVSPAWYYQSIWIAGVVERLAVRLIEHRF